jgi:hypothetical protein
LAGIKLLIVQPLHAERQPVGAARGGLMRLVRAVGENVFFVRGKEASFPFLSRRAAGRCRHRRHVVTGIGSEWRLW